jgi:hypothetical protein
VLQFTLALFVRLYSGVLDPVIIMPKPYLMTRYRLHIGTCSAGKLKDAVNANFFPSPHTSYTASSESDLVTQSALSALGTTNTAVADLEATALLDLSHPLAQIVSQLHPLQASQPIGLRSMLMPSYQLACYKHFGGTTRETNANIFTAVGTSSLLKQGCLLMSFDRFSALKC